MTMLTVDEERIRETAYQFWLDEGQPEGRDREHWLKAVDALMPTPKEAGSTRKAPTKTRAAKSKAPSKTGAAPKAKTKTAPKKPRAPKAAKTAKV
ncbi:DUF2934 domain-containing protein [Ruegeria sp. 2205SS24-7]|uniref:DUF2934 domain-containing protein n=1 Tax=Ruegeria discodermiae TaxID=3064389 RepID=UPI002740C8C4|nr:DUF2934 domain-containing protein [Ruegeria sp. 2205SS24-7]MDP5219823.1 DUF2934 domain-containing protein [Ruegeria sp. 2205SS24-7]